MTTMAAAVRPRSDVGRVEEARMRHLDIAHHLRCIADLRVREARHFRALASAHVEAERLLLTALGGDA